MNPGANETQIRIGFLPDYRFEGLHNLRESEGEAIEWAMALLSDFKMNEILWIDTFSLVSFQCTVNSLEWSKNFEGNDSNCGGWIFHHWGISKAISSYPITPTHRS
jgi:hypothetical protein